MATTQVTTTHPVSPPIRDYFSSEVRMRLFYWMFLTSTPVIHKSGVSAPLSRVDATQLELTSSD